jgi:hypothetical protein
MPGNLDHHSEIIEGVSTRMHEIGSGLSPEFEFIAGVNWLGKISSINRVDQTPPPVRDEIDPQMRIPNIGVCISLVVRACLLL